jgi:hypothetical protein
MDEHPLRRWSNGNRPDNRVGDGAMPQTVDHGVHLSWLLSTSVPKMDGFSHTLYFFVCLRYSHRRNEVVFWPRCLT